MCPFYNAQLFEITGTTKGVFTHSQSSCHIAKVVLAFRHDSRQIPIASDAPPRHTSRGFLHWRFAYAGPGASRIVPDGRHPKPFTTADIPDSGCDVRKVPKIGIGGSLAAPPLPHHRTYGSVYGGSRSYANALRSNDSTRVGWAFGFMHHRERFDVFPQRLPGFTRRRR